MTRKKTDIIENGKGPRPVDLAQYGEGGPRKARGLVELALSGGERKGLMHLTREVLRSEGRGGPYKYLSRLLGEMTADGLLVRLPDPKDFRKFLWRWADFEEADPSPETSELPEWLLLPDRPSKVSDPEAPDGAKFHYSCGWRREREGKVYVQEAGRGPGLDMQSLSKSDFCCWLDDISFYTKTFYKQVSPPPRNSNRFGQITVPEVQLMLLKSGPEWEAGERALVGEILRVDVPLAPVFAFLPEGVLYQNGIARWRDGWAFHYRTGIQDIRGILRTGKYLPPADIVAQLQKEIVAQFHGTQGVQQVQQFDWRELT